MSKAKKTRPKKPRPDFPLFPHATGRWAKKVCGRTLYFGKVADDPKGRAALDKWLDQRDDLLAGRTPRPKVKATTIRDLANHYLTFKRGFLDSGELTARAFADMYACCERLGKAFGWHRLLLDIGPPEFEALRRQLTKGWCPERLAVEVGRVRSIFRYALDAGLMETPVRYGSGFRRPSARVLRVERARRGPRMFEAAELRAVLDAAGSPLRTMVLLGINCGFGNADVAALPVKALDLAGGWVTFARGKTGIGRRCPLWPETVKALREATAQRPKPAASADGDLVFLTRTGRPFVRIVSSEAERGRLKASRIDELAIMFRGLLRSLKIYRPGLAFYALRHGFETVAGDSRDQVAVDAIMGHARQDMASRYRERIDDARLVAVTEHVRKWLFGNEGTK